MAALPPKPLQARISASQPMDSRVPSGRSQITAVIRPWPSCRSSRASVRVSTSARVRRRLSQRGHQRLARALAQRVHAAGAMTGVQEAVQQLEAQPGLFQRVDGGRRGPA